MKMYEAMSRTTGLMFYVNPSITTRPVILRREAPRNLHSRSNRS